MPACTLVLALPPERICVGPQARFGFHQPARDRTGVDDTASAMMDVHPPLVQQRLRSGSGGLPPGPPQDPRHDVPRRRDPTCG